MTLEIIELVLFIRVLGLIFLFVDMQKANEWRQEHPEWMLSKISW